MTRWRLYDPTAKLPKKRVKLPDAPPWRRPGMQREEVLARTFRATADMVDAVNAALHLRRPLLVTGKPGTGKSSLIYSVAERLALGPVLVWAVNSRSTLQEGLYQYDALARLQHIQQVDQQRQGGPAKGRSESQSSNPHADLERYLTLGALGTALASRPAPRALLIDEIDKSDVDLPNDLLNILETGRFVIPELRRVDDRRSFRVRTSENERVTVAGGDVTFADYPFIVMTSNGERDFPAPFLRRCVQCEVGEPDDTELAEIVAAHFPKASERAKALVAKFVKERGSVALATDQLLNAVYSISGSGSTLTEAEERKLLETLWQGIG